MPVSELYPGETHTALLRVARFGYSRLWNNLHKVEQTVARTYCF